MTSTRRIIEALVDAGVMSAGLINFSVLGHQAWRIYEAQTSAGQSLPMYIGFLFIQAMYLANGIRYKNAWQTIGMGLSMVPTIISIVLVLTLPP